MRLTKKKILFINTHYAPDYKYGGVVESGSKLFKCLRTITDSIKIVVISENPARVYQYLKKAEEGFCYKSIFFHSFGFSISSLWGLWKNIKDSDVIWLNGLFSFHNTLAFIYTILLKKEFIVSLRGGFEEWSLKSKAWKKKPYCLLVLPLMRKARYIHVTSELEKTTAIKLGFVDNIIYIPNGIDIELFSILPDKYSFKNKYDGKFIFLFLSRTDKEKGLDILIDAYRKLCENVDRNEHLLVIAGPDLQDYLKKLSIDFQKENIERMDGVYGEDKIKLIRRSDVVILPSYSENFGNIVAEALACERPVITTTGTPWKEIENIGCGYYIRPNKEELYNAMKAVYQKSKEEREEMGKKGRKYIFDHFNWESKAKELFKYLKEIADEDAVHEK